MNEVTTWPNHSKTVITFFVVGGISFILALAIFALALLPSIKEAGKERTIKEAALAEQARLAQPNLPLSTAKNRAGSVPETNDVAQLIVSGKKLDYDGNYQNLGVLADKILTLATTNQDKAMGHYLKASYEVFLKDYVGAKKSANNALSLDPNSADAYNMLSFIAGAESNNELSLQYAEKALAIDPNNAMAHNLLGIAYNYKGWYALSVTEMEKAISLDPNKAYYKANLRTIKSQVAQ